VSRAVNLLESNRIVEENSDLVGLVKGRFMQLYGYRRHSDEVESAVALALVEASRKVDLSGGRSSVRGRLVREMMWDVLDTLRSQFGKAGSARATIKFLSIHAQLSDESEIDEWEFADPNVVVDADGAIYEEMLHELLGSCPNDRYREVVLRTVSGETEREIAERLGVSESLISKMLTRIRRLDFPSRPEPKEETCRHGKHNSLTVSWR